MCECEGKNNQRVGAGLVRGAQVGLTREDLAARVERLAGAIKRAGIDDPSWSAWLAAFRNNATADITSAAEALARYAERLGGAMSGRVQVSGVGAGLVRDVPPEVMQVENALDGVLGAIAPVLPYGAAIKSAHDARRQIMYGSTPSKGQPARQQSAPLAAKVTAAQATTRAARRGDPVARQRVESVKARASSGDASAVKEHRTLTAVRRDDSKRIDAAYRARGR